MLISRSLGSHCIDGGPEILGTKRRLLDTRRRGGRRTSCWPIGHTLLYHRRLKSDMSLEPPALVGLNGLTDELWWVKSTFHE